MKKQCPVCDDILEATPENFYRRTISKDGLQQKCKLCDREASSDDYSKNVIARRKKRSKWQDDNYELHVEHNRKYQSSDKYKITRKEYNKKNIDKIKEYHREYKKRIRESINE